MCVVYMHVVRNYCIIVASYKKCNQMRGRRSAILLYKHT